MLDFISRAGALALAATLTASLALAQNYPSRPVSFVVPYTAGTGMDIIARTVGQKLSARLGEPIVVENKPGASGAPGSR